MRLNVEIKKIELQKEDSYTCFIHGGNETS